jgi:hypothetical protein
MSAFHAFCSEWPYAVFLVFRDTLLICGHLFMNSTISTPLLSQKTVAISFLAGRQLLFKLLRFFWWMCVHPLLWLLTALWFQYPQMKPRFNHLLLVRCDWEIHRHLCGIAPRKSKPKPFSAFCAHPWAFSEHILREPSLIVIISQRTEHEICGDSHETSEIVKRRLSQMFWSTLNKTITLYRWPADHFALLRENLFPYTSLNILCHCLTVPSLFTF